VAQIDNDVASGAAGQVGQERSDAETALSDAEAADRSDPTDWDRLSADVNSLAVATDAVGWVQGNPDLTTLSRASNDCSAVLAGKV
jgi:hypothetical protein